MKRWPVILATVIGSAFTAPSAGAQVALDLTIVQFGGQTPLPGVSVTVMAQSGTVLKRGITDGAGMFVVDNVPEGSQVIVEYELFGFVRRPERRPVVVGQADTAEILDLVPKAPSGIEIQAMIDQFELAVANVPEPSRAAVAAETWSRLDEIEADAKSGFVLGLFLTSSTSVSALQADESFRVAANQALSAAPGPFVPDAAPLDNFVIFDENGTPRRLDELTSEEKERIFVTQVVQEP